MKNNSTSKAIIVILALLLLAAIGYLFMTNNKLKESNTFLEEEKTEIQNNLEIMIADLDEAIIKNTSLSDELKLEREDIILFRDSIKNLKQTNYSLIRRYRKKIKELETSYQELFVLSENLKVDNQNLTNNNQSLTRVIDSVKVFSESQKAILDSISIDNAGLTEKVATASKLQVNSIKAISMRQRNNGNLVETSRASRTDALRVSFRVAENLLAEAGDKNAVIQVLNPDGEVVKNIGSTTLKDEVTVIDYTDETNVDYINENLDVILVVETDRKQMKKGIHTVNVYLDGRWVGASKVTLR